MSHSCYIPAAAPRRRVLVVDDDEAIRALVALALLDEGYEVVTAADGAIALEHARTFPPGLILLDMDMPVMNGWQFAAAYQLLPGPHAPIVVFSAAHSVDGALAIGAAGAMGKPFDLDVLSQFLQRYLPPRAAPRGPPAQER